jgi:hypothetical protein
MQGATVKWHVAIKRGKIKAMREGALKELLIAAERTKAQIRARVEHPFHVIKNLFGHRKLRYKGLAKNTAQLLSLRAGQKIVVDLSMGVVRPECAKRIRSGLKPGPFRKTPASPTLIFRIAKSHQQIESLLDTKMLLISASLDFESRP